MYTGRIARLTIYVVQGMGDFTVSNHILLSSTPNGANMQCQLHNLADVSDYDNQKQA